MYQPATSLQLIFVQATVLLVGLGILIVVCSIARKLDKLLAERDKGE